VTSIAEYAFASCTSLASLTIPASVTSIGNGAFEFCTGLTSINVDPANVNYSSDAAGVLYNSDKSVLICYPPGKTDTSYAIPDSVTGIRSGAFYSCTNLTSVTIPDSVTSIGEWAFDGCSSLASVTIPDSVGSMGEYAFYGCASLASVTIGNSVTSIGAGAFYDCTSLTSVTIPDSVTSIGDYAFSGCANLASVTIGNSVTSIRINAFTGCLSLSIASFLGNAPAMENPVFWGTAPDFHICYTPEASGFSSPTWEGYPAEPCASADNPPSLGDGPFLAAGWWPMLPTSPESAFVLDVDYDVLWTFSDDFASCEEDCTHTAEYQAVGGETWTSLDVTANAAKGTARVTLPVESLQNATTYAFRYSVTDCAGQTTSSGEYYFRVATSDAPPVIVDGPFLASDAWPVLPTAVSRAFVLDQDYDVLWTFSDDYAYCSGLCTHRARYRKIVDDGSWIWEWLPVTTDATNKKYAYVTLPIESMEPGEYMFYFDVRDCAGQRTSAPKVYYFKVEADN